MLNSLIIENFRSLEKLEVSTLGRINLIVGRNNSGKSSVLDALKVYASSADESIIIDILNEHDEFYILEEKNSTSPFESLFYGRKFQNNKKIVIGEIGNTKEQLTIEPGKALELRVPIDDDVPATAFQITYQDITENDESLLDNQNDQIITNTLKIIQNNKSKRLILNNLIERANRRRSRKGKNKLIKAYSDIKTSFISNEDLADAWDKIALIDYANEVLKVLQIIEPKIQAITFVNAEDWDSYNRFSINERRIPLVKMDGLNFPVPLKSMGDGIIRLFQLSLRLYEAKDGFLFIDEFENGLHFGVQKKAWEVIFDLSNKLNIQVFSTTHSWDCIESFTQVALERTDIEGCLFRLGALTRGPDKGKTTATIFTEEDLRILTQSQVEVR